MNLQQQQQQPAGQQCVGGSATDQLVLVGRHRREHRLREDEGAELLRLEVEQRGRVLLLLDDVDPRLVLVHGVQDDLQEPAAQAAASAC